MVPYNFLFLIPVSQRLGLKTLGFGPKIRGARVLQAPSLDLSLYCMAQPLTLSFPVISSFSFPLPTFSGCLSRDDSIYHFSDDIIYCRNLVLQSLGQFLIELSYDLVILKISALANQFFSLLSYLVLQNQKDHKDKVFSNYSSRDASISVST